MTRRHQWMADKLTQSFGVTDEQIVACFRSIKKKLEAFFADPTSPPKLFFYYQPRKRTSRQPELFLASATDGDKLEGKCLWFLRNTAPKQAVNTKIGQDATVLCGEMNSEILQTFEGTLSQVYAPLLKSQEQWGQITQEKDKRAFLDTIAKFDEDLKKRISNLRGDVELRSPESPYDKIEQKPASYAKAAQDAKLVEHFSDIVNSWCEQITKYMEDDPSNTPLDKHTDSGPDVEIDYWSRRMLTLISITEQLKMGPNRVVTGVLKARALRSDEESKGDDNVGEQEQVKNLIEKWREVDLAITDALNEAKDNVRFLENLRKVIEPLYTESPLAIAETMPSLMNSMKMIHTLSRHYGTDVRMTNLFERITNQLITRSKDEIYGQEPVAALWRQAPDSVIAKMQASIKLLDSYRFCYQDTKAKLAAMPKGKQFSFDENAIFGKFDRFARRLDKLIDMFSSIKQFKALEAKRIDGMESLVASFDQLINEFKLKGHDLLDFYNTVFERDYVEFTMKNSGLENAIQEFMESSLAQMSSIDKKLELMKKFQEVLHRDALQEDLELKYLAIFRKFGESLHEIQYEYDKNKNNPPIPRNMTRIAGNIHWSRQLLRRITSPMKKFQQVPKVFHPKESKKIIARYNKLARVLIKFETLYFQAWETSTEAAKKGLRSRLIVANPHNPHQLLVNFDHGVLQLMREAKYLQLMGFEIPNSAKIVLLLEDKLKTYYNEILHALNQYNRVTSMVSSEVKALLRPHLLDLENAIKPARTTMTWTSMNIEQFLTSLHTVLHRFEYLVKTVNDIITNRIQKNLTYIRTLSLLSLPAQTSFNIKDFSTIQHEHVTKCTEILLAKNVEVERAVDDLVDAVLNYPIDKAQMRTPEFQQDINWVKHHFCMLMYHSLLASTKSALSNLKRRLSPSEHRLSFHEVPLFEADVSLQVPSVTLSPSLAEMHEVINSAAREVLQCTKKVFDWGLDATGRHRARKSFYEKLSCDKNLAVVLLLLTGSIDETKHAAQQHLQLYGQFDWLWKQDPEVNYAQFAAAENRVLEDFVAELHRFVDVETEIAELPATESLGSLNLQTENLKMQLRHEVERWKYQYAEKLHQEAKHDMETMTDIMNDLKSKLERKIKDFASLKFVMDAQAEIREVQSSIDSKFDSIIERYNTLEKYLPFGVMTKDEMDAKSVLRTQWSLILAMSAEVMDQVNQLQDSFKDDLVDNVRKFKASVIKFRAEYDAGGPMVKNISPQEAITRLNKYKREFETLNRKYQLYNGGEKLFGLPEQKYPDLQKTSKELKLLDQLYSLYQEVISTVDEYKGIPWSEVVANINEMNEKVSAFSTRCRQLPKGLKNWEAYLELSQTIDDFIEILPLLTELSQPCMRDRHWKQISKLTGKDFDLEKFHELKLRSVLEANLLDHRDEILEITDAADKQLAIEKKLLEISSQWDVQTFEFATYKDKGEVVLAGLHLQNVVEQLEESQNTLIQMLTQRHVTPFREQSNAWLKKLSDVSDVLDGWHKVQTLWTQLEPVFTGGDIARQMPQDTRVFQKVDKEWTTRLMNKAKDVKNVVDCCQNEYIKNMLPDMHRDLEKCQKALDGYLETKRAKFPRFYFVSDPALLVILSQGSDKESVQGCFSKVFDAIERVTFQGNNIVEMRSVIAGFEGKEDSEDIRLTKPVLAKGNIEDWLLLMQREMARTIKDKVREGAADFEAMPLVDFINKHCAQVSLLGIQFMWTSDVQEALIHSKHDKSALQGALNKQHRVLTDLTTMTTDNIESKMKRTKIETLVTIQVHQRDVLDALVKRYKDKRFKPDVYDFEWQKQLRCYWQPEDDECVVRIADVDFTYAYEYLGCKERLVVTPLTDRCYISLAQAWGMCYGGAPAGPAGTGKTETVKDLARALGKLVVVFNCSNQMQTADTAKLFKGLCQSGSWGCFDEFNRIDLDVLSVVAQQVQAIFTATRTRTERFAFPGDDTGDVILDPGCGIFITMNPGYFGRQELPENLKALFRSVAMMVPDREIIIKVKLASVGYERFDELAVKFRVLYNLCEEQLSKQRHYDFGLRNILSVLRTAGVNLRVELAKDSQRNRVELEHMLMMRTLRDMNLSKLDHDDVSLFIELLHDLFPNTKDPEKRRYDREEEALRKVIEDNGLIHHDTWVEKIVQLYETSLVRHGLMMVGQAGGGKSMAIKMLLEALSLTHEKHSIVRLNAKAVTTPQLFGLSVFGSWVEGVFSAVWQRCNLPKKNPTWIVVDSPVDAVWIENLNTVLDDNKLLTLANGDRLPMTDNVRLLFEVEDLRNASPATVSRNGIIFVSSSDLGYVPIVQAWLKKQRNESEAVMIYELYQKYIEDSNILVWLANSTKNVMKVSQVHLVTNCFHLLEGLLAHSEEIQRGHTKEQLERLFIFCLCWSLGALLETEDRIKFSNFLRDLCSPDNLPPFDDDDTLYEWFVDEETLEWERWEAREWNYHPEKFNFSTALVPTVDSARAEYLMDTLLDKLHKPVLILGSSGTAKTSIVLQFCNSFDPSEMKLKKINFSSATTQGMFQASIEADVEKRQRNTYAPQGAPRCWMTVFLDDLSMPQPNEWGDQPTLEIVRQLIETGGFYFLEKDKRGEKMNIENMLYVGAMNHPGGGRNDIPNRLKRHFFTFNMTPPSHSTIDNIYGSMLRGRFDDHDHLIQQVHSLTAATIDLWDKVKAKMLPTPSKFHYIFNMRDLSRVFQGIMFCPVDVVARESNLVHLWKHECDRVFCDKLTNAADKRWYEDAVQRVMENRFGEQFMEEYRERKEPMFFVDFLRDEIIDPETDEVIEEAPKIYEPVPSVADLKLRVENFLQAHNDLSSVKPMHLVLFEDALHHVMRISRIIGMPRGNALLVGVGGSGRQSLARLAAYIAKQEVFQIKRTTTYQMKDFLEDIRKMYVAVGKEGKKLTWIFTDFEIVNEDFLEYVNAILSTGEIAGLFPKEERDMMCADLRVPAKKEVHDFVDTPDNLYKFFIDRIRDNLHIVLCFSPANEKFAERARRFPALFGGCTIDWFLTWPEQALIDVSQKFLVDDKSFRVEADMKVERSLVRYIANVHRTVMAQCDVYFEKYRRRVHVTPKSYLSYIKAYKIVYREKLEEIATLHRNVELGLSKLKQAERDTDKMKTVLEQQNEDLKVKDREAAIMLDKLEVSAAEAAGKKEAAEVFEAKLSKTAEIINAEKAIADNELAEAMPFVYAAEKAAKSINKKDITFVQKLGNPSPVIKRIMDCVLILNMKPLEKVNVVETKIKDSKSQHFVQDSYDTYAKKFMVDTSFTNTLMDFAVNQKDNINEETMEFLEPYLELPDFTPERARLAASAAECLCRWVRAMHSYHIASLNVAPKVEELRIKTDLYQSAMNKLAQAKAASQAAQAEVDELQRKFSDTMATKAKLERKAKETQEKMQAASSLIKSLAGEKKRWAKDAGRFAESKNRLVGDCAIACAFVSYLGPFNHEFRKMLMDQYFYRECVAAGIPVTDKKDLDVNSFLVDAGTIAEWNSQGLPKDDLSIQNGILVTQASRYPLLIDPQGQALSWLKSRDAAYFPKINPTTTITHPKLRDQLELCMSEGKSLLIEGILKDVDPVLDPVLEKNIIQRGRQFFIGIGEKSVSIDPSFRMYLITKLSNPVFSPELSAKTTIIDFSVTQKGLEDQLLSRVIQQEQRSLEEQRQKLIEEVNMNTISLQSLDKQLLDRLGESKGDLLDDLTLIGVLADTKTKSQEVAEKIASSTKTEELINNRREQYRPVATRGSLIYFVIVSLSQVNWMYQTSLSQFLQWFDSSMVEAEKHNVVHTRVNLLKKYLTYACYCNINLGLFEKDKLTFKLMLALKILVTEYDRLITPEMINVLLRGGASIPISEIPANKPAWLQPTAWANIYALSKNLDFFDNLPRVLLEHEAEWRQWYEAEAPELAKIPQFEDRLTPDNANSAAAAANAAPTGDPYSGFMRFLLLRCFRDDRARLAANSFIKEVLEDRYNEPVNVNLDQIVQNGDCRTPIILLLTPGADPTAQIEAVAKMRGIKIYPVSMGQGQEPYARKAVYTGMEDGNWALLQNCHLGLGYMNTIEEEIRKAHSINPNFRLWITCEPHDQFPVSLLQMSIKITNEPPAGMKAGLRRSYTSVIDAERLGRVETKEWRDLVFCLCFLHSAVQERRKFGAIGWCIPYEFNMSDLEASLTFLEKHLFSSNQGLNWPTIQYMICEVQYGGRVTDDMDRVLFNTFGKNWLVPRVFDENFQFTEDNNNNIPVRKGKEQRVQNEFRYCVPQFDNIEAYRAYINSFPSHDSPEVFGLHANADITFGTAETAYILNTIAETQPKDGVASSKSGAKSREDYVFEEAEIWLSKLPSERKDELVRDIIRKKGRAEYEQVFGYKPDSPNVDGFSIPLNVFLYQEITRLNATIQRVRQTLQDLRQAIAGEIILTPELQDAINSIYNAKPARAWYLDAGGAEIAWTLPTLSLWFNGLLDREKQLSDWLLGSRPNSFWLTGFFNPQGFLTAARQEIARRHKMDKDKWALDQMVTVSEVTDVVDIKRIKHSPEEGVYVHGMFLEGCSWDKKERMLEESKPKELFTPLPVVLVSAVTTDKAAKLYAEREGLKYYDCPVYTKPRRTGANYVFSIKLKTTTRDPKHWVLRGVALLCSKD